MKFSRPLAVLTLACLPSLGLTGCNSTNGVRLNMTNAADSTTRTQTQDLNDYGRIIDHNNRAIWDDLARVMLLDRPSRLSPWSVP